MNESPCYPALRVLTTDIRLPPLHGVPRRRHVLLLLPAAPTLETGSHCADPAAIRQKVGSLHRPHPPQCDDCVFWPNPSNLDERDLGLLLFPTQNEIVA